MEGSIPDSLAGTGTCREAGSGAGRGGIRSAKSARTKWDSSHAPLPSRLHARIFSILKPEQWDRDDQCGRAAICLVRGFPIIMCQLNLTTVHYSGLRIVLPRSPSPLSSLIPLIPLPWPTDDSTPPLLLLPWPYMVARPNRQQQLSSTLAIQLLFNIIGAGLESSCLCLERRATIL